MSARGIDVATSWSGPSRQLWFPNEHLKRVTAVAETAAVDESFTVRLFIATRDDEGVTVIFESPDRQTFDAFAAALRKYVPASRLGGEWLIARFVDVRV